MQKENRFVESTFQPNNGNDLQHFMKLGKEDTVVKPTALKEVYMKILTNINPKKSPRVNIFTEKILKLLSRNLLLK